MMNNTTAKFKGDSPFIITGRGLVFLGDIIDGTIYTGDFTVIQKNGLTLRRKITGVEMATNGKVGILIKCDNEEEKIEFRQWDIKGIEFEITHII